MTRRFWVLVHRYAGLYMACFLIVAGVTGSVIAFYDELDRTLNPYLRRVVPRDTALDAPALIERAEARVPEGRVTDIILDQVPDESTRLRMKPRTNPVTGEPYVLDFTELYLDPYTGRELGRRSFGDLSQGLVNLMPFIYRFHYSLALGEIGTWLLGIAALIWTVDCFVGFYLTLPPGGTKRHQILTRHAGRDCRHPKHKEVKSPLPSMALDSRQSMAGMTATDIARRSFWHRWKPAWCIKWRAGATRINFDLHRAGGLWVWPMLLVFAWSAVAFNLSEQIYKPVMRTFFEVHDPLSELPVLATPLEQPALGWRDAMRIGRELMAEQPARRGFSVMREQSLVLDRVHGVYRFSIYSNRDIGTAPGSTTVLFDANSGSLKAYRVPTGQYAGNTVTAWLLALHQGEVFGLPYRIFVCTMGFLIAMLSVTGIYLWIKKRRSQLA